jgi:hypothetical protein
MRAFREEFECVRIEQLSGKGALKYSHSDDWFGASRLTRTEPLRQERTPALCSPSGTKVVHPRPLVIQRRRLGRELDVPVRSVHADGLPILD